MRRGETSTRTEPSLVEESLLGEQLVHEPGRSPARVPSSCRITDSQTLYGSSSQPISTSSVRAVLSPRRAR